MWRIFGGILLGLLLFLPGVELLRMFVQMTGFYDGMTLTDGCLAMIIILLCIQLLRERPSGNPTERRSARQEKNDAFPLRRGYQSLSGPDPRHPRSDEPLSRAPRRPR